MFLLLTRILLWLIIAGFISFLLSNMLITGLISREVRIKSKPNQGIWMSRRNAIIASLIICLILIGSCGLIGGLIGLITEGISGLFLGILSGLSIGLLGLPVSLPIAMMKGGGKACIRHLVLRLILYRKGYIPWNYARFLDYATERIFMQKVGGGYIFVHRVLMEHFAKMELEQEQVEGNSTKLMSY